MSTLKALFDGVLKFVAIIIVYALSLAILLIVVDRIDEVPPYYFVVVTAIVLSLSIIIALLVEYRVARKFEEVSEDFPHEMFDVVYLSLAMHTGKKDSTYVLHTVGTSKLVIIPDEIGVDRDARVNLVFDRSVKNREVAVIKPNAVEERISLGQIEPGDYVLVYPAGAKYSPLAPPYLKQTKWSQMDGQIRIIVYRV